MEAPATTADVSTLEENTGVGFLDLPPELRNRVYEYAFTSAPQQAISIIPKRNTTRYQYTQGFIAKAGLLPKTPELAILTSCKQIQAEAAPILFSKCHIGL